MEFNNNITSNSINFPNFVKNTSNIYNLDMDLVRELQTSSKKEDPELDEFYHYCNAVKKVMNLRNIKPDFNTIEFIQTLIKYTDK